jgi:outer membrane protein TolC
VLVIRPAAAFAQSPAAPRASDTLRLSLGDAVSIAMRQSDEIGIAAAQVDVADALYGSARANALPQLRFSSSYLHVYQSARGQAVGSVFNQPNTYTANLNFSQTLFQGGRIISATRSALRNRESARFDERETRAQLTLQVERAYLEVLYSGRISELQDKNLELAATRLAQVEQFEKAGRAARYDVLRARVERSNIEPLAIQARNTHELSLVELKRVLNLPVDQPVALITHIDTENTAAMLASLGDTSGVPDRASVHAAELNLDSRKLGVSVARADFYPTVTAFFQSGYQAFPPIGVGFPTSFGTLTETACPPGSVAGRTCQNGGFFSDQQMGINISVPVFDGFRVKSNLDFAQAQARLADLQLRQEREAVSVEVARARAELRRASAVYAASQQNSQEAEEAFRLATLRFSRGLSTQLEVSDVQLQLLTATTTEARATYDLFLAAADLARALGRPIPIPSSAGAPTTPR